MTGTYARALGALMNALSDLSEFMVQRLASRNLFTERAVAQNAKPSAPGD
ncbi:hypothetical protein SAMN04487912_105341 [Arthrobacter sp. cf158]|nr:hypothetical protein [Arthrobacter sp. cf158]SDW91326.1 hypothetical protein SAMN04487912_105341 [Arthrobacter sp. cf158]